MTTPIDDEPGAYAPRSKLKPDGSLSNPDYERVAIRMAEGVPFHQAWEAIGKKAKDNGQRKYRNQLLRQSGFKNRVKQIMDERTAAEAEDDIYGEPKFLVMQLYREAMAISDLPRIQKAVEMRLAIAREIAARRGAPPAAAAPAALESDDETPQDAPRPVGRPPADAPQTKSTPSDIKRKLMEIGGPAPGAPMAAE